MGKIITTRGFNRNLGIHLIPIFDVYYNESTFLETGVYTPSLSISLVWLKYRANITFQLGY
jgi:hypothetical protein